MTLGPGDPQTHTKVNSYMVEARDLYTGFHTNARTHKGNINNTFLHLNERVQVNTHTRTHINTHVVILVFSGGGGTRVVHCVHNDARRRHNMATIRIITPPFLPITFQVRTQVKTHGKSHFRVQEVGNLQWFPH